jgi:aspartate-semialdehyde dehydrogenase
MEARKKFRVGLIGTDTLRGKEIKSLLSVKRFPLSQIEFFDPDVKEEYGKLTQFHDEPRVIHHPDSGLLEGLDLVFLASDRETNLTYGKMAQKKKFRAIDLGDAFAGREDVPAVVAGVNDGVIAGKRSPLIQNPHAVTIIVSSLLHPLLLKFGISKVVAFVLQPVSAFDESGIDELASQSAAMLSGAAPKKRVFKDQIAFNILSHTEAPESSGFSAGERQILTEIRRVLSQPVLPLSLSIVQAPVFHTYSVMAYVELAREASIADLEETYKKDPLFKVKASGASCPVSAVTVAGKEQIFIGQIKKESEGPKAFWIWTVTDNLTRGSALNALEIARVALGSEPRASSVK